MSDNKKYYYLKLKDNFFDSEKMVVLEAMKDGYLYSNILLKLYLKSLKFDGKLMFTDKIPYNSEMLASVVRHPVGVLVATLKILKDLDLVEIWKTGEIFLKDIQNFVGHSSTEADRIRKYRDKINEIVQNPYICTPDIRDKSLENRDKNKEKNIGDFSTKNAPALSKVKFVIPTIEEIQEAIYEKNYNIDAEQFFAYYDQMGWKLSNGNRMQNWKSALTTWNKREPKQNQTKTQAIDYDKMTRDQIHIEIKKVVPNIHLGFCWKYIDENYYIFKNKTHSMMNGSEYYRAMMQASNLSHCKVREENKSVENQNAVYNIAKNLF